MEQVKNDSRSCFQLVTGKSEGGKIQYETQIGYAFKNENDSYYVLKMWMHPNINYYLARTKPDENRYMVFTKKLVLGDGTVKLQNPVATARASDDLRTHLEISFRFPRTKVFMSLFPLGDVNV